MGFLSALIGGSTGIGMQMFANAAQKVPLSRRPWMHAGLFIVGCYVGGKYPRWEANMVTRLNEKRHAAGLPPLVGTNAWIRYQPQQTDTNAQ